MINTANCHSLLQPCGKSRPFKATPLRKHSHSLTLSTRVLPTVSQAEEGSDRSSCTPSLREEEGKSENPSHSQGRAAQALTIATSCSLIFPPASLAEQHSGLFAIADLDPKTAALIASILAPVLTISTLLMICRIPLSWYPNLNIKKLPWAIAVVPTEPILGPTRRAIPPIGGVDIAPIIWVSVLTFINEILLGPQGILNLLQRQSPV